jgi:hypothetical protein
MAAHRIVSCCDCLLKRSAWDAHTTTQYNRICPSFPSRDHLWYQVMAHAKADGPMLTGRLSDTPREVQVCDMCDQTRGRCKSTCNRCALLDIENELRYDTSENLYGLRSKQVKPRPRQSLEDDSQDAETAEGDVDMDDAAETVPKASESSKGGRPGRSSKARRLRSKAKAKAGRDKASRRLSSDASDASSSTVPVPESPTSPAEEKRPDTPRPTQTTLPIVGADKLAAPSAKNISGSRQEPAATGPQLQAKPRPVTRVPLPPVPGVLSSKPATPSATTTPVIAAEKTAANTTNAVDLFNFNSPVVKSNNPDFLGSPGNNLGMYNAGVSPSGSTLPFLNQKPPSTVVPSNVPIGSVGGGMPIIHKNGFANAPVFGVPNHLTMPAALPKTQTRYHLSASGMPSMVVCTSPPHGLGIAQPGGPSPSTDAAGNHIFDPDPSGNPYWPDQSGVPIERRILPNTGDGGAAIFSAGLVDSSALSVSFGSSSALPLSLGSSPTLMASLYSSPTQSPPLSLSLSEPSTARTSPFSSGLSTVSSPAQHAEAVAAVAPVAPVAAVLEKEPLWEIDRINGCVRCLDGDCTASFDTWAELKAHRMWVHHDYSM